MIVVQKLIVVTVGKTLNFAEWVPGNEFLINNRGGLDEKYR
jgi:hypothetical protein